MGMSWDEAVAQATKPGGLFELAEAEIGGQRLRVFKNTPPSLRALFAARARAASATFLVYEDERWSFADVMAQVDALGAALVRTLRRRARRPRRDRDAQLPGVDRSRSRRSPRSARSPCR